MALGLSHIWAQIGPPDPLFGPLPEALLGGYIGPIQPEARSNGPVTEPALAHMGLK